jgi:hypothetical protein
LRTCLKKFVILGETPQGNLEQKVIFSGMPNHYKRYCRAHGHLAKACPLKKLSRKTKEECSPPQPHLVQDGKAPCANLTAKSKLPNQKPNKVRTNQKNNKEWHTSFWRAKGIKGS